LSIVGALIIPHWLLCDANEYDNSDRKQLKFSMNFVYEFNNARIFFINPAFVEMRFFHLPASTVATKWFHQSSFHLYDQMWK